MWTTIQIFNSTNYVKAWESGLEPVEPVFPPSTIPFHLSVPLTLNTTPAVP